MKVSSKGAEMMGYPLLKVSLLLASFFVDITLLAGVNVICLCLSVPINRASASYLSALRITCYYN